MKHYKLFAAALCLAHALCLVLWFSACDDTLKVEDNPNITRVFLVGDALKGWNDYDGSPLARPMLRTGDTVFSFRGNLTTGFLKISCDEIPDWDGYWYLPPKDTVLNTGREQPVTFSVKGDGGEDGPKWEITLAAQYAVTLDKAAGTIKCEMVGDFRPEGTSDVFYKMWFVICDPAPLSLEMEQAGDNWIISRQPLRANDYVKFYGESLPRTDWNAPYSLKWFCPLSNGAPLPKPADNIGAKVFKYGADNAFAWSNPSAAFFMITLSPRDGTVTFDQVP